MENLSNLCENILIKITNDDDGTIIIKLPPDEKTTKPQTVDDNALPSKQHYYQSFFGPTLDETLLVGCETIRDSNNWDNREMESVWGIESETTFSEEERREDSSNTFKVDNDEQLSETDIDEAETTSRSNSSSISTSSTSTTTSFKTSHFVSDENISNKESISSLKKQTHSLPSVHFIPEESFTIYKKEFYCKPKQKQEGKVNKNEFLASTKGLNGSYNGKSVSELKLPYCITVSLTDNKSKKSASKESNTSRANSEKKTKEKRNNKESQNFSSLPETEDSTKALNGSYNGKSVSKIKPPYGITVSLTDNKSKKSASKESNTSRASSKKRTKEKRNNKENQDLSSLPEPEAPVISNSNSRGFNSAPKKITSPEVIYTSQRLGSSRKCWSMIDLNIAKEATEKDVSKCKGIAARPERSGYKKKRSVQSVRLSAGGKSLPGIGGYTLFERMLSSIKNSRRQQMFYKSIPSMGTIKGCFMLCPGCEKKVKPLIRKQKPIPSDLPIGELGKLLLRCWPFSSLFPLQQEISVDLCCPDCTLELGVFDTEARTYVQHQWERSK